MKFKLFLFSLLFSSVAISKVEADKQEKTFNEELSSCSCKYLYGQRLKECMDELDVEEYKKTLKKLTIRTHQRKEYFKRILKTEKDYQTFFDKFTQEEWNEFWPLLKKDEQSFFPKDKSDLPEFLKKTKKKQWKHLKNEINSIHKHPVIVTSSVLFGMSIAALIFILK